MFERLVQAHLLTAEMSDIAAREHRPVVRCLSVKDTLSIGTSDPKVINEVYNSLAFRVFAVTVPHLRII